MENNLREHAFPDNVLSRLEEEQESLSAFYRDMVSFREDMQRSAELLAEDDTLSEHLNQTIQLSRLLFENVEKLRWSVLEHNVDASPRRDGKVLSTEGEINNFFSSIS